MMSTGQFDNDVISAGTACRNLGLDVKLSHSSRVRDSSTGAMA